MTKIEGLAMMIHGYFIANEKTVVSTAELTRRIHGAMGGDFYSRTRKRLIGRSELTKKYIDKILSITNLTYEEAFKRSDNDVLS